MGLGIPRRFDLTRALATPRAVKALIGPRPRVIADDLWRSSSGPD